MVMEAETLFRGAPTQCPECGKTFKITDFEVLQSAAGYYVGTRCSCGPYTRETIYFETEEQAERSRKKIYALLQGKNLGELADFIR